MVQYGFEYDEKQRSCQYHVDCDIIEAFCQIGNTRQYQEYFCCLQEDPNAAHDKRNRCEKDANELILVSFFPCVLAHQETIPPAARDHQNQQYPDDDASNRFHNRPSAPVVFWTKWIITPGQRGRKSKYAPYVYTSIDGSNNRLYNDRKQIETSRVLRGRGGKRTMLERRKTPQSTCGTAGVFAFLLLILASALIAFTNSQESPESTAAGIYAESDSSSQWWHDVPVVITGASDYTEFFGGNHGGGNAASEDGLRSATWGPENSAEWNECWTGTWNRNGVVNYNEGWGGSGVMGRHGGMTTWKMTDFYCRALDGQNMHCISSWKYFPRIDISYDSNTGNGLAATVQKYMGNAIYLDGGESFSKNGYHFKGWSPKADGSGGLYASKQRVGAYDWNTLVHIPYEHFREDRAYGRFTHRGYLNPSPSQSQSFTLYAIWEPNQYGIVLDPGVGQCPQSSISATFDAAYPETAPIPTSPQYDFAGWFSADGTQYYDSDGKLTLDGTYTTAADTELVARYTPKTFEVSFDANCPEGGNIMSPLPETVLISEEEGFKATAPAGMSEPAKPNEHCMGYMFTGWYVDSGCSTRYDFSSLLDSNKVLYAGWEKVAPLEYVIEGEDSLDRKGIYADPLENDSQGYHAVGQVISLTDTVPTRAAHEFLGWSAEKMEDIAYLDDAAAQDFIANGKINEVTMFEDGVTVYAVWQEKYSHKILNGDFEYPRMSFFDYYDSRWVGISLVTGTYEHGVNIIGKISDKVEKWRPKQYAWYSTMKANTTTTQDGMTEIQREIGTDNQYADLAYGPVNSDVYQDIITIPNSIYKWRIKQCSNTTSFNDILNVKIGNLDSQSLQPGWRVTQNVSKKDPLGYVGINMSTTVSQGGNFNHKDQWETYTGIYQVPNNQWVTRFRFCMANNNGTAVGCLVDDIDFSIAYPLHFDVNGGTNKGIYTDPAADNYAGYHQEEEQVELPMSPEDLLPPDGCMFLGWSEEKHPIIDENTTVEEKKHILDSTVSEGAYAMPAKDATLYAVYAKSAQVDVNASDGGNVTSKDTTAPGVLLPSFEYEIVPEQGFRIQEILVDGRSVIASALGENERHVVSLEDVAGSHSIEVTFRDMRLQMPETGQWSAALVAVLGMVLVAGGIGLVARNSRQSRSRGV